MKERYCELCDRYYEVVGNRIENEELTQKEVKSLFDNFMLKVVNEYFEEEEENVYLLEKAYRKEVEYYVENYNENNENKIDITKEERDLIASLMIEDDQFNVELFNTIQYYLEKKFSEKFESEGK